MAEYQDTEQETVPFVLRRRTPESRAAYIAEKVPVIAKRFNCTEQEARLLLEGATDTAAVAPPDIEAKVTPATGSIRFVLERPDDETLTFTVEFEGQGGEQVARVTHDSHGWDGMGLLQGVVQGIGEALGIEVVER